MSTDRHTLKNAYSRTYIAYINTHTHEQCFFLNYVQKKHYKKEYFILLKPEIKAGFPKEKKRNVHF